MASGRQMLEAVLREVKGRQCGEVQPLSVFDAYDLYKLEPDDLKGVGFCDETIEEVISDLRRSVPSLNKLGDALGVRLVVDKSQKNLIPGEGIRRTAGIWANGDDAPQSIMDDVRMLRNPAS